MAWSSKMLRHLYLTVAEMVQVLKCFCAVGQGDSSLPWLIAWSVGTNKHVEILCAFISLENIRSFSVSIFSMSFMSCSNDSKNAISDLLRTAETDSWWTLKAARKFQAGNYFSIYVLDALCICHNPFKGGRVCKENTHANTALVRGNCNYLPCSSTQGQNYCMS